MLTPDELRALALLAALLAVGAALTWLDARHPRILTLTLGDSLALGAPASDIPDEVRGAPGAAFDSLGPGPGAVANRPIESHADPEKSAFGIDGRLDLNTATADELEGLPGIGPKTAQRILEDRRMRGPFRRPSDLTRVKGIGPKTLARLTPLITVSARADSGR